MMSGTWPVAAVVPPREEDTGSVSSVSLLGSGIVSDTGTVFSQSSSKWEYSMDGSSAASSPSSSSATPSSSSATPSPLKKVAMTPSPLLFFRRDDDSLSSEESSLLLYNDTYFIQDDHLLPPIPKTLPTCGGDGGGIHDLSSDDGIYEDHVSSEDDASSVATQEKLGLDLPPTSLDNNDKSPPPKEIRDALRALDFPRKVTPKGSSSPSRVRKKKRTNAVVDNDNDDEDVSKMSLADLLLETPPRLRNRAASFLGLWPSRRRLEQEYTLVDATKATQYCSPVRKCVSLLSSSMELLGDQPSPVVTIDLDDDGLTDRATAQDLIQELGLGDAGWSAMDQLEELLEQGAASFFSSPSSSCPMVVEGMPPTLHVAGIPVPDYDAYVRQAVTLLCRDELLLNEEDIGQSQCYLFGM